MPSNVEYQECLVMWSTNAQIFLANLRNTLDISTEFPDSISADTLLVVSKSMKLGPGLKKKSKKQINCTHCSFEDTHNVFVLNDLI